MASLESVANLAGVSKTTVHRVLNNDTSVAPITADVVLRAARKIGYVPRRKGRFASSAIQDLSIANLNLGILFHETRSNSPLTARLLHGFEEPFSRHHLRMNVIQYNGSNGVPLTIKNNEVDGLIVRPGNCGRQIMEKLPRDIPSVWLFGRRVGEYPLDVDSVNVDDITVGQLLFNRFYNNGHSRMAVINPWSDELHEATETRIDAFKRAGRKVGVDVTVLGKDIQQAIQDGFFKGPNAPSAVYVGGAVDEVLFVYNAILRAGLVVGKDIDFGCCIQAVDLMRKIDPNVYIVDINSEQIAETAVELLMWRLQHPQAHCRTILIEPTLIEPKDSY